ncbi:Site-specific recombinase XerD [Pandoraea pulmonicola]|uniref:Site-specific recombinase XerD n=1 Tax=Pandoraea pulmonicola TaxID=93221 RepID=A0AAJ4ZF43_PANPU|nr:Site-specific recombinase XerD [Pandoraea pulmonicola]
MPSAQEGAPAPYPILPFSGRRRSMGRDLEAQIDRGQFLRPPVPVELLGTLLDRYCDEVSPSKRSGKSDLGRAKTIKRVLGKYSLPTLTPAILAEYRNARLRSVGPQTVIHELNLMSRALRHAVSEWGVTLPAGIPTASVRKPQKPSGRTRRVADGEIVAIEAASLSPVLGYVIRFAVETAMRRGEIAGLCWEHVDLQRRTAHIPRTKTDVPRTVPLSSATVALLEQVGRQEAGSVFGLAPDSTSQAFERALNRARRAYVDIPASAAASSKPQRKTWHVLCKPQWSACAPASHRRPSCRTFPARTAFAWDHLPEGYMRRGHVPVQAAQANE